MFKSRDRLYIDGSKAAYVVHVGVAAINEDSTPCLYVDS